MFHRNERIWLVGAQGQVGSAFLGLLDTDEVELLPTDQEDVDITNSESVRLFMDMNRPEIIINCAGMTSLMDCEENKEDAFRVNALGPRNLSVAARSFRARMVQFSTDDVFDGKSQSPYDEFDPPSPVSVYGKSKLAGENFVKELAPKHLIIRSSWVYGKGNNFVTQILERIQKGYEVQASCGQFASPTSAVEVAKTIYLLLEKEAYGTYHATCQGYCSRYDFARKIAELCGSHGQILKTPTSQSPDAFLRPSYTVLDNLMLRISGLPTPVHWEQALKQYLDQENKGDKFNESKN